MTAEKVSGLLNVRKAVKAKKPGFGVQKSNDPVKRFAGRWKRPKGIHSKMRHRKRGNPAGVEPGYGSPALVRGMTAEGMFPVVVRSIAELGNVREGCGVVVSASLGLKKKAGLVKAAAGRGLKLLNVDTALFGKRFDDLVVSRKKRRQEILQKRKAGGESGKAAREGQSATAPAATRQSHPDKSTAQKSGEPSIEGKLDDDAIKKAEKAEKDKVLIKPR